MVHPVDSLQRGVHGLAVAQVAHEQLGLGVQMGRRAAGRVGERIEVVEYPYAVPVRKQSIDEV